MIVDKKYMARCLQLAKGGRENVAPNPMVGCVVVHDGKIIGEGFHRKYGEAHAEVNAIVSVKDQSLLKDSTLYVSLEPCSHYGKTPPCAELIIQKKIPRVVVACLDPFPAVSGRGVNMLRKAGIEVLTGVMEQEARKLNRIFMVSHLLERPYVLLKWAQSLDGFMDISRKDRSVPAVCFSTPDISQRIHKLRSEYMAIMVGYCTGVLDNPSLTVRSWSGRSPVRVLVDRNLDLPPDSFLLDGSVPTILFTEQKKKDRKNVRYIQLDPALPVLKQVLESLYSQQITSLMVEGGSRLLSSFIQEDLWDEMQIETAPLLLHEGVQVPSPCWREKAVPVLSSSCHIRLLTNPVNRIDRFLHTGRL